MLRIRIDLAYDGKDFSGWQIQEKPDSPPTIQGAVEAALFVLCGQKTRINGAGRTDAGVHAYGQVAHFDWPANRAFNAKKLQQGLNALLPPAIRILNVSEVEPDFHSRKSALSKTYIYYLWPHQLGAPPMLAPYVWDCGPVNIAAMQRAMQYILGKHDFASYQNRGTKINDTVREVYEASLEEFVFGKFYPLSMPALCFTITANGFLKQMVRNIVGMLVYAGKKKFSPENLPRIEQMKSRQALPVPTAPACGLALAKIRYA